MKKIIPVSLVFTKLSVLFCLSLMGFWGDISHAETPPPCHQTIEQNSAQKTEPQPCSACEISESTWSQPFIWKSQKINFLDIIPEPIAFWIDTFDKQQYLIQYIKNSGAPPETKTLFSHLIQQSVTRLLL